MERVLGTSLEARQEEIGMKTVASTKLHVGDVANPTQVRRRDS